MDIEITQEAAETLARSLDLAGVDRSAGGIRLRGSRGLGGGFDVQVEFAAEPEPGEEQLRSGGLNLFVDPLVSEAFPAIVVALEPQHETVVVRPRDPA